jgi:hypothetical protein
MLTCIYFSLFSFSWMSAYKSLLIELTLERSYKTWYLVSASLSSSRFVLKCNLRIYRNGPKSLASKYEKISLSCCTAKMTCWSLIQKYLYFMACRRTHQMPRQVLSSVQCWLMRSGMLLVMRALI